jgi:glutamate/tyrosine decarboxylase-like PLP-dependent enzyme
LYCGTYANQQALYMALHHWAARQGFDFAQQGLAGFADPKRLAVLVSEDAHFSMNHAVRVLGLGEGALIQVAVDENRRMDPEALREKLAELDGERDVFCVVATAGTTSTGSVDPVDEIGRITKEADTWFHVDGAYGLAYALVPEVAPLFAGLERADTITWDPHKQMGVPIPNSILFARDRELFKPMALFSNYWNRADAAGPNPGLKSVPSTRPFSALPLVTSIRHQGLTELSERLRKPIMAIREFHAALPRLTCVEPLHVPDTGILCFRLVPAQMDMDEKEIDRLQEHTYRTFLKKGKRIVSVSKVGGKACLRAVAIIPEVTSKALLNMVYEAQQIGGAFR